MKTLQFHFDLYIYTIYHSKENTQALAHHPKGLKCGRKSTMSICVSKTTSFSKLDQLNNSVNVKA